MKYKDFWEIINKEEYLIIKLKVQKFWNELSKTSTLENEMLGIKTTIAKYLLVKENLKKYKYVKVIDCPLCEISNGLYQKIDCDSCIWKRFIEQKESEETQIKFLDMKYRYKLTLCETYNIYYYDKKDFINFHNWELHSDLDFIDKQLERLEKFKKLVKKEGE